MKKVLITCLGLLFIFELFAISYDDNEYQRKSRAYTELSAKALEEGDYDASIEYSRLAEEYARLSAEFIQKMLARIEAEQLMNKARSRYQWAKRSNAEKKYPSIFVEATEALDSGTKAFDNEDYDVSSSCANRVLAGLAGVEGDESMFAELPAQYKVRTWRGERDCLWTIAELSGVFSNALLWQKLYVANKNLLPRKYNPDLIVPGMILKIPSIRGEKRIGLYDHNQVYRSIK